MSFWWIMPIRIILLCMRFISQYFLEISMGSGVLQLFVILLVLILLIIEGRESSCLHHLLKWTSLGRLELECSCDGESLQGSIAGMKGLCFHFYCLVISIIWCEFDYFLFTLYRTYCVVDCSHQSFTMISCLISLFIAAISFRCLLCFWSEEKFGGSQWMLFKLFQDGCLNIFYIFQDLFEVALLNLNLLTQFSLLL